MPASRTLRRRLAGLSGADDLMMRTSAATARKEHELTGERTRTAFAAAKARGRVLDDNQGLTSRRSGAIATD